MKNTNTVRDEVTTMRSTLDPEMRCVLDLTSEKGVSDWLTRRPLKRHGFQLTMGEFRDAVYLRYNWLYLPGCQATAPVALLSPLHMLSPVPLVAFQISVTTRFETS